MSAAFALDYFGDPVLCDFPGCILEAFHDGEHERAPKEKPKPHYDQHCIVCGRAFTVYGGEGKIHFSTCGSQECLEHYARHTAPALEVSCSCPQRSYPHELNVHSLIRNEWFAHKQNLSWPWSLMASVREEPSTERKNAE